MKRTLGQIIHGMVPDRDIQGTWINEPWEGEANQPAFEQAAQAVLAAAGVDAKLVRAIRASLAYWHAGVESPVTEHLSCAVDRIEAALRGEVPE